MTALAAGINRAINMHNWHLFSDFDKASVAAADFLALRIEECLETKMHCHVVLPGGNSPAKCLSYLANKNLAWHKIHWYLSDERCYPSGHTERNDVMLEKNLWSKIPDPVIHRIPAELGVEKAAEKYREIINGIECFDVVFLGMGEDGHTASLFPANDALNDCRSVIPVYNSPKPPAQRVSLSRQTLLNAKCRMVLTGGTEKSKVLAAIKQGELLPVNQVGDINWFLDELAMLDNKK